MARAGVDKAILFQLKKGAIDRLLHPPVPVSMAPSSTDTLLSSNAMTTSLLRCVLVVTVVIVHCFTEH